jgi:hypothetical protein
MFMKFGEIKSCKVARDPQTLKSRCYGYVWFMNEDDCATALKASDQIPYQVQYYKSFCLRACEQTEKPLNSTIVISGYPQSYTENDLKELIGPETIDSVNFTTAKAEVTFKTAKLA